MSEEQTVQTGPPLPAESGDINYALAALAGVAAAAVGAGLWYGFVVITDIIFGGVAIAIGLLVGYGVVWGAGNKRGFPLQVMGASLSLLSILAGEYLITNHMFRTQVEGFTGWISLEVFIENFKLYISDNLFTLFFYAIAIYEGYILPKPDAAAEIVVPD